MNIKKIENRGIVVMILIIIMLILPIIANAQIWDGVTCNQPGQGPCVLCDMAHVAANVLDLLLQIVLYLGMAFVVVGALMMILGSTNQKYYDQGRDAIKWALIGVAVATTAWLVVGTIFATFANQQFSASWDEIDCDRFDFLTEPPGTGTHVPQQPGEGTGVGAPEPTDEPETPSVTIQPLSSTPPHQHGGSFISWGDSLTSPQVQANLSALQQVWNSAVQVAATEGFSISPSSVYRPQWYQNHFVEIVNKAQQCWNLSERDKSANSQVCDDVFREAGPSGHGLCNLNTMTCTTVSTSCSNHTRGYGIDIRISGQNDQSGHQQLSQIFQVNNIALRWANHPNDPWHYDLINPPNPNAGC